MYVVCVARTKQTRSHIDHLLTELSCSMVQKETVEVVVLVALEVVMVVTVRVAVAVILAAVVIAAAAAAVVRRQ